MLVYGNVSVSSSRCCMCVSCVHRLGVLNAALCMTCSLLIRVEHARGGQIEESYSRAILMTALLVAMSISWFFHPVAVGTFMICRGLCVY